MEYSLNVVLIEPEIPQNTGNIARTCAATGARLHLVGPMGFEITEKRVRRAGLDYWDKLDITYYESTAAFFEKNKGAQFFYFSTKARNVHSDMRYPNGCFLVFGKETKGLPEELSKRMRKGASACRCAGSYEASISATVLPWVFTRCCASGIIRRCRLRVSCTTLVGMIEFHLFRYYNRFVKVFDKGEFS